MTKVKTLLIYCYKVPLYSLTYASHFITCTLLAIANLSIDDGLLLWRELR